MRLLVLYHAGFNHTPALYHYLSAIKYHSVYGVDYFNVDQDDPGRELDFGFYDAVFVNYCVVSIVRVKPPPFIDPLISALRRFTGVKIASIQDEYDFVNLTKAFLLSIGVNAILTCIPKAVVRKVYYEPEFDAVRFRTVQTAYLADDLLELNPAEILPLAERPIPLGYRGRPLPYRLGDLGWHKTEIALRFKAACARTHVSCDIEVDENKRFFGEAWLLFVRQCRVNLGTPSGSNVFDLDGSLHRRMAERWVPGLPYEEVRDEISSYEITDDMGQVSARIFEAVAQKTALALIRGNYSGVLEPEEHYVPIEPDYSNIDQVMERITNVSAMQDMADRAYQYVIDNPRNYYDYMVSQIDALIDQLRRVPAVNDWRSLNTTSFPLGYDPYLFSKLLQLRDELGQQVDKYMLLIDLASQYKLEVIRNPDGTYRVLPDFTGVRAWP